MEEFFKLILTGLIGGIVAFFSLFASEKGRNLAKKQDIAEITHQIEEVKHQYNLIMEQFKGRNQLKLAAIDKRLEAHQRAFSLWRELSSSIMTGKNINIISKKCEDWWWENCFYLDAESSNAFWDAFRLAPENFHELPLQERIEIRHGLEKTFLLLQKGVELPSIKDINLDDFLIKKEKMAKIP
jgi:hypothetical protein